MKKKTAKKTIVDARKKKAAREKEKVVTRLGDGVTAENFVIPGMNTLIYVSGRGKVLCPICAARNEDDPDCPEIDKPVKGGTYDEGPPLECQSGMGCGVSELLESTYGEQEEES